MGAQTKFKLTYGTMFNPPEEFHERYESELAKLKSSFGKEYPMIINGKDVKSKEKFENRSPIDTNLVIGLF
ncbi:MAG: 1-pyrroline-5-carboxylate dehydrogenase, partial [Deltaproteobacteria bacterium HGW-Deltaproteobacteria-7]